MKVSTTRFSAVQQYINPQRYFFGKESKFFKFNNSAIFPEQKDDSSDITKFFVDHGISKL